MGNLTVNGGLFLDFIFCIEKSRGNGFIGGLKAFSFTSDLVENVKKTFQAAIHAEL